MDQKRQRRICIMVLLQDTSKHGKYFEIVNVM